MKTRQKKILKSKKHSASWQIPQSTQGLKIDPTLYNRIIGFSDFLCRGILEERSVHEINARLRQIRGAIFQELHYSELNTCRILYDPGYVPSHDIKLRPVSEIRQN